MIYPKFVNNNSTLGITSLSSGARDKYKKNKYKNAKKTLENLGYKLIISDNINKSIRGRCADEKVRAEELNNMFKNNNIDLILNASGGDFLIEILPYVNFELLKSNPKYVCGFSDPTSILYTITTKYDIATIYGQNYAQFGMRNLHKSQKYFLNIINGKDLNEKNFSLYEEERKQKVDGLEEYNLTNKVKYKTLDNKDVCVRGRIIGGCFDIISELSSTKYDGIKEFQEKYKNDGIIWYFDNCELSYDETIRTLWKLNELEYFKYTKCIIFGRFGNTYSSYKYNTKTCLLDSVISKLNIPIIYDADFSHKSPCLTVINGSIANIKLNNNKFNISFELK